METPRGKQLEVHVHNSRGYLARLQTAAQN